MKEIWGWFLDLNGSRNSGFGASPITYTEIRSYFCLNDIDITPFEVGLIKMLDKIALSSAREQEEKNKINKPAK